MRDLIAKGILPEGKEAETIDEIIREENIINFTKTIEAGSQKGDNYLGGIYRIIIKGIDSITKEPRELYLILKCSARGGEFRESFPHNIVFQHECYMYNEYLPKLYDIQKKYGIENGLKNVAKLYKYSTVDMDEFIVLEDMKQKGFVMLNRQECLDLQHCKFVLRQLAYLHGLGFVFKHKNQQEFQKMTEHLVSPFQHMDRPEFRIFMENVAKKALGTLDENTNVYKGFVELQKNLHDTMDQLKIADKEYSIVVHNDCWNNNFLFKYEDENDPTKPTNICLIDWQISELHSPVKDLSYFIYNCTSSELRNSHFNDLLNYYYEQLTQVITDFNCS
ncbi:uncharacterized protein LOC123292035 isoform X2 [Chrysoperla carnea]|uniref:uncharacterized protein LOC123292035 isoform X2 n=1 Tax=Chrysoperla carnea TaxID=189513 RepID=UPI001D0792EE|nr:uncharacterized protein LOC123292035 isoform X2 [Chrysoperla carnea]